MEVDLDAPDGLPPEFPELKIPEGQADIQCKFCKRSKFLTINTTVSPSQALALQQLTLRWRRERGNQCAPCLNFQARKATPSKFRAHLALRLFKANTFQLFVILFSYS